MSDYPLFEFKITADCAFDLRRYVAANKAWNALGEIQQYLRSMAKYGDNNRGGNLTPEQQQIVEWLYEDVCTMIPTLDD